MTLQTATAAAHRTRDAGPGDDGGQSGRELRRADLVERFGVSATTARRDLRALIDGGDLEFVGPTKTGYYRLKSGSGRPALRRDRDRAVGSASATSALTSG